MTAEVIAFPRKKRDEAILPDCGALLEISADLRKLSEDLSQFEIEVRHRRLPTTTEGPLLRYFKGELDYIESAYGL
jgi:hypothetical protein